MLYTMIKASPLTGAVVNAVKVNNPPVVALSVISVA